MRGGHAAPAPADAGAPKRVHVCGHMQTCPYRVLPPPPSIPIPYPYLHQQRTPHERTGSPDRALPLSQLGARSRSLPPGGEHCRGPRG